MHSYLNANWVEPKMKKDAMSKMIKDVAQMRNTLLSDFIVFIFLVMISKWVLFISRIFHFMIPKYEA